MYENALAIKIPPADKILPGYFRTKKLRNLNQKISDRILYYVIVDTGYTIVLAKILFFVIFFSSFILESQPFKVHFVEAWPTCCKVFIENFTPPQMQ